MVHAKLCKMTRLVFFFVSLSHFDFLNCESVDYLKLEIWLQHYMYVMIS